MTLTEPNSLSLSTNLYDAILEGGQEPAAPISEMGKACGQHLWDLPDWRYLLREYYEFYRGSRRAAVPRSVPTSARSARRSTV